MRMGCGPRAFRRSWAGIPEPASAAQAVDAKTISPAVCQPYAATTLPSDLSFRAHGLKNVSSNAEYVVCSITVDHDVTSSGQTISFWSDANTATVEVLLHAASAGTPQCELYMGSNLAGGTVSLLDDRAFAAGQVLPLAFVASGGTTQWASVLGGRPPVSLFCRLPPGASILKIEVRETGLTQN